MTDPRAPSRRRRRCRRSSHRCCPTAPRTSTRSTACRPRRRRRGQRDPRPRLDRRERSAVARASAPPVAAHAVERWAGRAPRDDRRPGDGAQGCPRRRRRLRRARRRLAARAGQLRLRPLVRPSSLEYYRDLAAAGGGTPIVLYNVPTRVGVNLEPPLVIELARDGVIAAVKDSSGNLEAHRLIADGTADVDGFRRFTGSELSIDGALLAGFDGAVPGLANVFVDRHVALLAHADGRRLEGGVGRCRPRSRPAPGSTRRRAATNSFSGVAIGALKEALVQLGIIAHATTSPPFGEPDERATATTWPRCSPTRRVGRDRRTRPSPARRLDAGQGVALELRRRSTPPGRRPDGRRLRRRARRRARGRRRRRAVVARPAPPAARRRRAAARRRRQPAGVRQRGPARRRPTAATSPAAFPAAPTAPTPSGSPTS